MNESNKVVLRRYHDDLSKDIIVTEELLGELFQVGVFQKDMIEIIRCQVTPSDKIQKLLEILPKRGPDALDKFIGVIEGSYPWLATVLTSAQVKSPAKGPERGARTPNISHSKNLSRSSLNLDDQQWNLVDVDIKRIVAAFVHRQFGQSKRVSEKDKKSVERFMADQIQRERTRYQSILASTSCSEPSSRPTSCLENDVFQSSEVQESLFSVHLKLEQYITKCSSSSNNNNNNGTTSSSSSSTSHDGPCTTYSKDDDGHPDYKHQPQHEPQSKEEAYKPKLMPEDMDFNLVNKEVDIVLKQVEMLEETIADSLNYFDSRDHHHSLPSLVQNLVSRLECQENEMSQDRRQIKLLLDKAQNQAEFIEKLEKERLEHRKQIQAAYLDMASLRQEKCALQDRVNKLEKERRQHLQEDPTGRIKVGIMSKQVKTPRGGQMTHTSVGLMAGRNYSTGNVAGSGVNANAVSMSDDGYARRGVSKSLQRPGNAYLGYARRNPQGSSRYGAVSGKKKAGRTDMYSSAGNLSSTTKF